MKHLPIKSPAFQYVEKSFKEWLDILGYAEQTTYSMPVFVRGMLHYIEQKGKTNLTDISAEQIRKYYKEHLKQRPNLKWGGGLSNSHLNKHLQALYKFCDYLRQSGRHIIAPLQISWEKEADRKITVLTEEEIHQLYKATEHYPDKHHNMAQWLYPALELRDKAMLTAYYACGLRRNEGLHLDLDDILWEKQILHVRKGKNYKERFVPIEKTGLMHFENYIYNSRSNFLRSSKEEAIFVSNHGKRMQGQMMLLRLNSLVERTENTELQEKEIGLHTLRHSIATHLLSNGMKLEKIKDFLGHSSLESTQIYTHLTEEKYAYCNNTY